MDGTRAIMAEDLPIVAQSARHGRHGPSTCSISQASTYICMFNKLDERKSLLDNKAKFHRP